MHFSGKLYPYQCEILDVFERERQRGDKKIHIVAPPGSGKTIVGLEMMMRIDTPTLILVPNLTLEEQWKDKIEKLYLEAGEHIDDIVSTDISLIKRINIVTYQSLSGSDGGDDEVQGKILDIWYESEKGEFPSREAFLDFARGLKEVSPDEYREHYGSHRKKLKDTGESDVTRKLMKDSIHEYVSKLRELGVELMIVDEAHHLTAWWSHVLYEIWTDLNSPYIVGLTATPPFESVDYFELDESYTKLLGTVDYYIPTPAIVKSGRLAPYSDLLVIVSPDHSLSHIIDAKEQALKAFLTLHALAITQYLHTFLSDNFEGMRVKSLDTLEKWMRFIYTYKENDLDMGSYITANAREPLTLEDIAKSVGKWSADGFKKSKQSRLLNEVKSLFFDLGYIWRGANLYRFQTPLEKGLIYSKSKMQAVEKILDQEVINLSNDLRVAIITDFLDVESEWINGHLIFDEVSKKYASLNPYLVSGQGIWKITDGQKREMIDETILSVTEKLTNGETKVVIGTRGILGEGWDCPAVNTLIDLTGVSAYMSVNQVHGRAIRIDPSHPDKVANIYDIVCIGGGYSGMRDFERLHKKHNQFYGVDDSGLIIKELDHIYPQLERYIENPEKINAYTMRKSTLRSMVRTLWNIGGAYQNTEVFSLSIEIMKPYEVVPIPSRLSWWKTLQINPEHWKNENLLELGKSSYHMLVRMWIHEILDATLQVLKPSDLIPKDFNYTMKWSDAGSITIASEYRDPLVAKKFLETVANMFNPITEEKYKWINTAIGYYQAVGIKIPKALITTMYVYGIGCFPVYIISQILNQIFLLFYYLFFGVCTAVLMIFIICINYLKNQYTHNFYKQLLVGNTCISTGIPDSIVSNEEKRNRFIGIEYGALDLYMNWCRKFLKLIAKNRMRVVLICIFLGIISTLFETLFSNTVLLDAGSFFGIILFSIIFGGIFGGIIIFIFIHCFIFLVNLPHLILAFIHNTIQKMRRIELGGAILPVEQSDIGQPSFLSAKIEKLWI